MKVVKRFSQLFFILILFPVKTIAQTSELDYCNISWNTQSLDASESMPCGGGDIGLNVWTENNEVLFYISKDGTFDENNAFLKLGRIRVRLTPDPFENGVFQQELIVKDGYISIKGENKQLTARINIWTEVYSPVIHIDIETSKPVETKVSYESWRYEDRLLRKYESFGNSYKWAPPKDLKLLKDEISFWESGVLFYHRNHNESTIFDATVSLQGLDSVKDQLFNPLENLTFGGMMQGKNMKSAGIGKGKYVDTDYKAWHLVSEKPSESHEVLICLHSGQYENFAGWKDGLQKTIDNARKNKKTALKTSQKWWNNYWNRSFVFINTDENKINSPEWQVGRNYQLFRYMLGCNAHGKYPTKFNGGLFTVDPVFTNKQRPFTPDFRNWGGGTFTAQNQRLVYFNMLKSGDFILMKPQFDLYLRILKNAESRSQVYWNHTGACFTEQIENFGLPNCSEYGWNRPEWYDKGMQYNAWLEYQWDTALEFCFMILETQRYTGNNISEYIPLIESCLTFFDEHYRYLAQKRGRKTFDANGHIVFYPGSSCETYKMAYNAVSTTVALKTVLESLLALPDSYLDAGKRDKWSVMLDRIPPVEYRKFDGKKTIAPAKSWERVNNTEVPQLYPVYPWGMFGIGKPGLDIAINTFRLDTDAVKFRSHIGWKQDNIFAARLGLTDEAARLTMLKLQDSERRFPAFWGPGFDWVPDHNWGGSGMIGLQEMLLQTDGEKIYLFPAWPKQWDVHFKLYAYYNTTVEVILKNGKTKMIKIIPESRAKDIINML